MKPWSWLLMLGLGCSAAGAGETAGGERMRRGFTMDVATVNPESMQTLRKVWNADIVRYHMRPIFHSQRFWIEEPGQKRRRPTYPEAWQAILKDLPATLDAAKQEGILLVLTLQGGIPNENARKYPAGRERQSAIWNDDSNREILKQCWREVAEICKDREEDIWFDLLNEPLDWADFPSYPKKWPQWAQETIDVIRAVDTRHPIVVEPGPGGLSWGFKDFPMLKGDKLIYSIHCYQPHGYSHQGVKDLQGTDLAKPFPEIQKPWPGQYGDGTGGWWDRERLRKEYEPVVAFQKKHGVPIFVGEFSVARWAPDAVAYLRDNIDLFEEMGWSWTYHAYRESYIWDVEMTTEFSKSRERTAEPGDRARLLLEYFKRNAPWPAQP